MSSNFNCSYIAVSSFTFNPNFPVEFFVQPIYTHYAEIYIFSNSSHLEWRAGLSDMILKGTHPTIFDLIWFSGFRREDLNVKPLNQITPNLTGMVPGWVSFKFVSDSPALHSRWLLLLKI
jgi:hypothetical protein